MIYLIIGACAIEFGVAMIPVFHEARLKHARWQYRKRSRNKRKQRANAKKENKVKVEPAKQDLES